MKLLRATFGFIYNVFKFLSQGWILRKDIGARFASRQEAYHVMNASHKGVLIDGKNRRLSADMSFASIGVFSPPLGGKTSAYIMPNILDKARQKCSLLITDPSGELYKQTSQYLKKKGFDIVVLDPLNLETSARFNPFEGLGKGDLIEIEKICATIIMTKYGNDKDPVWNEGAISLLEVLSKCLAYSEPEHLNIPTLNYLLQVFGNDGSNLDEWVAYNSVNSDNLEDRTVFMSWCAIVNSNANMLTTFVTIARTALKQMNNPSVQSLFEENDIDFELFRRRKTAIFIKLSEDQAEYFQFLIDVFYAKFFSAMMKGEPDKSKLDVYCMLDEFGSSYVDNFSMIINNIRKYRVSLSLVFQGISQIHEKYGSDKAKSIIAGMRTSIVYGGADNETAQHFSERIGDKITQQRRKYEDADINYASTKLMPPDKIRTLQKSHGLLVSSDENAIVFKYIQFFKPHSPFKRVAKKGVYQQPIRPNTQTREPFQI